MFAIDEKALARQIGRCLREARRARRWKQAQVAGALGLSVQFYGRIERGAALPGMATFVELLKLFGLSSSAVLGGAPAPPARDSGEPPILRRIARLLRRAPASALTFVRELLDELDRRRPRRD